MEKLLKNASIVIIVYTVLFAIGYLILAFVYGTFDITLMSSENKGYMVFIVLSAGYFVNFVVLHEYGK